MKKSLTILICVMLFLCQNSLYVTAEAASVIQIENKKATKEQEMEAYVKYVLKYQNQTDEDMCIAAWDWLTEYGCLEPYDVIKTYDEQYFAEHQDCEESLDGPWPGRSVEVNQGILQVKQNNMWLCYYYIWQNPYCNNSKIDETMSAAVRYSYTYALSDYYLRNTLKQTELLGVSREKALEYCNAIMDKFGYDYEYADIYTMTYDYLQEITSATDYISPEMAPGYNPVNRVGGKWDSDSSAYLIVYRNQSYQGDQVQTNNLAIFSPVYGLLYMNIDIKPYKTIDFASNIIDEEEAIEKAKSQFSNSFPKISDVKVLASEIVYQTGTSENEMMLLPYWKVSFEFPEITLNKKETLTESNQEDTLHAEESIMEILILGDVSNK